MADNLQKEGFDELVRALERAPEIALPILRRAMGDALRMVIGTLRPYPPQPSRDRARTFNRYVRGIGVFPRSSFEEAARKKRSAYEDGPGTVHRTSERMGEKWSWEVQQEDEGGLVGVLGNVASYSDLVQGQRQTPYHRQTGWITVDDALVQNEPQILRRFRRAGDEFLKELADV